MSNVKNSIIRISDEILTFLLEYREQHQDFTFALRERDSIQSDESRLENGQWFQGSDYIYVPLFKKGDSARKIKTIGFVLTFHESGQINENYVEISFKGGVDTKAEQDFHRELANTIGLQLNNHNYGSKIYLNSNNYMENLEDYIGAFREIALNLLNKHNISGKYLISKDKFEKSLKRVQMFKQAKRKRLVGGIKKVLSESEKSPLNQIFYGPPGTGKTYHTINEALKIILGYDDQSIKAKKRSELKSEFDSLMKEGQIVFTTFHQSLAYEDFIEGIKPIEPDKEGGQVVYQVQPGIFKMICEKALTPDVKSFENAYSALFMELSESDEIRELQTPKGRTFWVSANTKGNLRLHTGIEKSINGTLTRENIQKQLRGEDKFAGWEGYFKGVISHLKDKYNFKEGDETPKNYVLIIDEINRGNVSQIFGELITLLEADKRLDCDEALEVTLPYSKEKFGVPANLYIIGTMNTADRSVEALDTALRRRFSFTEMPPNYDLEELKYDFAETKGNEILKTINQRIEKLLDRDHLIGHSYLMVKKGEDAKTKLMDAFYRNIIPLLQEYFYGDYAKIGAVLGKGFIDKKADADKIEFADFDYFEAADFADKVIYEIIDHRKAATPAESFEKAIRTLMNPKK